MTADIRTLVLDGCVCSNVASLATLVVNGLASTPRVALVRIWTFGRDGRLQLAASAGTPTGGGAYARIDGEFGVIAAGAHKVAQIAERRQPLIVRSLRGDEDWISNPGWIARQGVRAFAGLPLTASDEVFGVLALFDRAPLEDEAIEDLRFVAAFVAARWRELRDRGAPGQREAGRSTMEERAKTAVTTILTREQLRDLERRTLQSALDRCGGRIFGSRGAAALLAMKATTLASRVKALGLVTRVR